MFDTTDLDNLAKKLCHAIPSSLQDVGNDLEASFKSILQSGLSKLDLVTREEFDAQVKVLLRTREKVEALQKQLDQHLNSKSD